MQQSEIISLLYKQYLLSHAVTTDTRAIVPGSIFFAFKGDTFDGNAFAEQALQAGASLCVISDERYCVDARCIVVPDVLKVLQQLALHHRQHLNIPVVGITGTNGKTTTKELVREVLATRYRVHATAGNFNNHLGVPLTLLSMPADTEIAIVEMGANHPGEIEALCSIALPTCGLITNVGKAHLEGFGSFEGVVHTKTELYRHLGVVGGTIFANADNDILMDQASKVCIMPSVPSSVPGYIPDYPVVDFDAARSSVNLLTYGSSEAANVKGALMECNPYMRFYIECDDVVYTIQSHLLGGYNFDNAMAAAAVGLHFGVEPFDIKEAIEAYQPTNNRSQYKQTERNVLFLDCYNANPSSMRVAVENFVQVDSPHKMVILGAMRELGSASRGEHRALVEQLLEARLDAIMLVGEEFGCAADLMNASSICHHFADTEAVMQHLKEYPVSGATILIKGSNANRLWQLEQLL